MHGSKIKNNFPQIVNIVGEEFAKQIGECQSTIDKCQKQFQELKNSSHLRKSEYTEKFPGISSLIPGLSNKDKRSDIIDLTEQYNQIIDQLQSQALIDSKIAEDFKELYKNGFNRLPVYYQESKAQQWAYEDAFSNNKTQRDSKSASIFLANGVYFTMDKAICLAFERYLVKEMIEKYGSELIELKNMDSNSQSIDDYFQLVNGLESLSTTKSVHLLDKEYMNIFAKPILTQEIMDQLNVKISSLETRKIQDSLYQKNQKYTLLTV